MLFFVCSNNCTIAYCKIEKLKKYHSAKLKEIPRCALNDRLYLLKGGKKERRLCRLSFFLYPPPQACHFERSEKSHF